MKKVGLYIIIAAAVLALIVWKLNSNKKENAEKANIVKQSSSGAVPVLMQTAALTAFEPQFTANGNFEAIEQIDFMAESSGRIVELLVKEGSVVKKGQTLARIDNQVAGADLENARAGINAARTDMERYEKALQTGGVTQKQVDDMKLQYQAAQARFVQAQKNAQNAILKAPIDGIVNNKYVEVGSYLSPGTKLFEIVNISKLKLVVNVPEAQVVRLTAGQQVKVSTAVYPDAAYTGKITFIAAKGDASLNYPVEIEVANNAANALKAGMYGSAIFELPQQAPALLIPRAAFYAGINSNEIYIAQNGKAVYRKVISGRVFGDKVEVKSGLDEGEKVIISGQVNLVNGTPIVEQQ